MNHRQRMPSRSSALAAAAVAALAIGPHVAMGFSMPAKSSSLSTSSAFFGRRFSPSPRGPRELFSSDVDWDLRSAAADTVPSFDPLDWCSTDDWDATYERVCAQSSSVATVVSRRESSAEESIFPTAAGASLLAVVALPSPAVAAFQGLSTGDFNPENFRPVCSNSDGFYRFLQGSTRAVVGDENFSEYGPLIAGGLLRIRLELCVVESFFNEAVGPFIQQNGLSWILPWHETVETFLAGTIFALATTFILVGSTKLIQIIAFYGDLAVGGPCRLFGGFFFDRARGEPVTLDVSLGPFFKTRLVGPPIPEGGAPDVVGGDDLFDFSRVRTQDYPLLVLSGGVKLVGETSKFAREFIEALDLFVGRYLVLLASGYIILKFVHFKIFPDFP